jgi:hypothetical protein
MPGNLYQLELTFDPLQDRLLLRLYTEDFAEFRLWLTRRYVKILWKTLKKTLDEDWKDEREHEKEFHVIEQKFQEEQSQRQAATQKYTNRVTHTPLGQDPILVSRLYVRPNKQSPSMLGMQDEQGKRVEIAADSKIILSLCKLLTEINKKAEWDLILD